LKWLERRGITEQLKRPERDVVFGDVVFGDVVTYVAFECLQPLGYRLQRASDIFADGGGFKPPPRIKRVRERATAACAPEGTLKAVVT